MVGEVIDYLLSVADEQAALPERRVTANIRATHDLHWFSVKTKDYLVEFEFLVLARGQSKVAEVVSAQIQKFVLKDTNFNPTDILIYSSNVGSTAGEIIDQIYGKEYGLPVPKEDEKMNA